MKPNVLVTGGSGFIGTHVLKLLLRQGIDVVVYDVADGGDRWRQLLDAPADNINFVRGDLNDAALAQVLDEHSISHIIHLAAWLTPDCQRDPIRGCEINVLGLMRLFEAMRERPDQIKSLTYASSFAVRGPDDLSDETPGFVEGTTFYGAFKRAGELIARQYWMHFGLPSVGLRPCVVYGPGRETGLSAAPTMAARAIAWNEDYTFPFSGESRFEFVEDTARAFVRSALEIEGGCYALNLPGTHASVEEIIQVLTSSQPDSNSRLSVDGPPLPYSVEAAQESIEQLFPDWKSTSLQDGLSQTVDFYRRAALCNRT